MQIFTLGLNPAIDRIVGCEVLCPGAHQSVSLEAEFAAGKSVNVSRALALLGIDSMATGFIGHHDGEFFIRELASLTPGTVRSSWVVVGGGTRNNLTILESRSGRETHLRQSGFSVSLHDILELRDRLVRLLDPGDWVVLAGSLPRGVNDSDFLDILTLLETRQVRIALDTSGPPLGLGLRRPTWLAKPNLTELSEVIGEPVRNDPPAIVAAVRNAGLTVENILVSRGEQGAILIELKGGGRAWNCRCPCDLPVIRTVSCGDHLLAGYVAGVVRGLDPPSALGFAVALATTRAVSKDYQSFDSGIFSQLSARAGVELIT